MTLGFVATQFLTGMATAATLFIVAVGLSLVFGISRIVNFAHGTFYMIGAYLAFVLVERFAQGSAATYWVCVVAAAVAVGIIGAVLEMLLLRRVYRAPELLQLLLTFAIVLVSDDLLLMIFGPQDLLGPRIRGLRGGVEILGERFPLYDLYIIALAPLIYGALWLLLHRTRWGTLVRAATHDRDMVAALGINQAWLFTAVFTLGTALAGLGGAVQVARASINLGMGGSIIAETFVVVVVGGMGSISGALLAAVLIGELNAFGVALFPQLTLVLTFLIMAVVLTVRPWGLLGKPEVASRVHEYATEPPLRSLGRGTTVAALVALAALAAAPAVLGTYGLGKVIEVLIFVVFACSLFLIMGPGGLVSFGHACYLGIGAYAVAMSIRYADLAFPAALALGVAAAGSVALVFGWVCVRVSGVYFGMLTLALAQIVWSVVFQWYAVTGGDNGIVGIWPSSLGADKFAFYYLVLGITAASLFLLGGIQHAPFGYALRTSRDSPMRAAAIGIYADIQRWLAFGIAGAFAGLAGGLLALHKGSVFPNAISVTRSIDGLVMVLLGGVHSFVGAIIGAVAFVSLQTEILRYTDYWRLVLGLLIILIVMVFPAGIVGSLSQRVRGSA